MARGDPALPSGGRPGGRGRRAATDAQTRGSHRAPGDTEVPLLFPCPDEEIEARSAASLGLSLPRPQRGTCHGTAAHVRFRRPKPRCLPCPPHSPPARPEPSAASAPPTHPRLCWFFVSIMLRTRPRALPASAWNPRLAQSLRAKSGRLPGGSGHHAVGLHRRDGGPLPPGAPLPTGRTPLLLSPEPARCISAPALPSQLWKQRQPEGSCQAGLPHPRCSELRAPGNYAAGRAPPRASHRPRSLPP